MKKTISFIEWLSGYTFPVYLIHFYIVEFIMETIFEDYVHMLIYKFTTPCLIFALSIMLTCMIRKIPIVRKVLP